MKNYISENISYLVAKMRGSQDELGSIFDLKRGTINTYISKKAQPKIETIQKICDYFDITIDAFINTSLEETNGGKNVKNATLNAAAGNNENFAKELQLRDDLIAFYKEKVERLEKSNSENSNEEMLFKMVKEIHHITLRNDIKQSIDDSKKDLPEKSI
ncbi:helix-turn-helix transcriptional regulator [Flavobacterium sp. J27]|uniref:helix-turn-helix transcriptional regulator n=1 Tax=Flavobacterium sp. J27 TaxID=2060419 RepID=UPI001030F428|nr:helix-turn-helix transcriptional regulator [Flavobacterium sp. J27]